MFFKGVDDILNNLKRYPEIDIYGSIWQTQAIMIIINFNMQKVNHDMEDI